MCELGLPGCGTGRERGVEAERRVGSPRVLADASPPGPETGHGKGQQGVKSWVRIGNRALRSCFPVRVLQFQSCIYKLLNVSEGSTENAFRYLLRSSGPFNHRPLSPALVYPVFSSLTLLLVYFLKSLFIRWTFLSFADLSPTLLIFLTHFTDLFLYNAAKFINQLSWSAFLYPLLCHRSF